MHVEYADVLNYRKCKKICGKTIHGLVPEGPEIKFCGDVCLLLTRVHERDHKHANFCGFFILQQTQKLNCNNFYVYGINVFICRFCTDRIIYCC